MRLWSRSPVGSFRSRAVPGTAEYFADLRAYRYGYETPFITRLFSFERMAGRRVLEIGVGNGVDAVEMARAGAHYTGIDVTARHLELTAANFALAGLPQPELLCAGLPTAPLAGPFDFVYSFGVLHHIPEEPAYLQARARAARPRRATTARGVLQVQLLQHLSVRHVASAATWTPPAR